MNAVAEQIVQKIDHAAALYHRLLLLVAPVGAGKTSTLCAVCDRTGAPRINANLELSLRMLGLTERQRVLQLPRLLGEIVSAARGEVVLLDNIELLFAVTYKQDPLRLLQGLSRSKTLVAAWSGCVYDGHLIYAAPGHPEYRRYPLDGLLIASPEPTAFR